METLCKVDPEVAWAISMERRRQLTHIGLIASENMASESVLEAQKSEMTNKYAEGYPRSRYYGGCEFVDVVEELAQKRCKKIFGAEHANVQPHSGTQANMAVYFAVLSPADTILAMSLSHGGHLTHGSEANFSGKLYRVIHYGVRKDDQLIDYEEVEELAHKFRPKLIVAGASAYPRVIEFSRFREIADGVGALLMVDMAHIAGIVAAGLHPNPIPYSDFVTATTHKTLRGPRGGIVMCKERWADVIDKSVFPGIQGGPLMHIIAAKAVCLKEAMSEEFKEYQRQVVANAKAMAKALSDEGFKLVSGGTDNHLILVDLTPLGMTGKEAEELLERANITVNKNEIPYDKLGPRKTSGIRIGTPCVTTRGMKEKEMEKIATFISDVLKSRSDKVIERVKKEVIKLCEDFPFYKN